MNKIKVDRTDQGILRSVALKITDVIQKGHDPVVPLTKEVAEEITDIISRLHNVELFADLELAMLEPAGQLKRAVLYAIKGTTPP